MNIPHHKRVTGNENMNSPSSISQTVRQSATWHLGTHSAMLAQGDVANAIIPWKKGILIPKNWSLLPTEPGANQQTGTLV